MARRRNLRLPSSSDEDEETPNPQNLNPNPNPYPNPSSPPPSPPLEISDDEDAEFADVPDAFSDPSPPSPNSGPNSPNPSPNNNPNLSPRPNPNPNPSLNSNPNPSPNPNPNPNPSVDPIDELLQRLGLRLRREWLESCVSGWERSGLGFERMGVSEKAKLCFEQFLLADMNYCGAGILPANVSVMHKVELEGPFVLQIDEVINISVPLRERYHRAHAGTKRCLKLSLTDGIQRVFGMEYRPIKDLDVVGPAGLKIIVRNIHIRRGLLMLVPEVLEVLGGLVEDLEAARERLVHEIDQPPRGKRRKQGNEAVPLAQRASLAAWPSATADSGARQLNFSVPLNSNNPQTTTQAAALSSSRSTNEASVLEDFDDQYIGGNIAAELAAQGIEERTTEEVIAPQPSAHIVDESSPLRSKEIIAATFASSSGVIEVNTVADFDDPTIGSNTNKELNARGINKSTVIEFGASHLQGSGIEEPTTSSGMEIDTGIVTQTPRVEDTVVLDAEDDIGELEHPLILTGDRELPFTYLACLLAKWSTQEDHATSLQGKIKCTLTGVKGFQFKHRSTFELHVYVDDGSLISEVVIDHYVVEKGIGHSPEEVTAALSSSDKQIVTDMKETMKKFQLFLAKFEGTILVEINENSTFPVVLEMNQGCSSSDAWMLLRRLKRFTVPQNSPHGHLKPIDLSP